MRIKDWKKEVFTIPNMLSFFRLILVPVYAYLYLTATEDRQYLVAGSIMAVSCLTDMIDGKIARRFDMVSTLGKVLDPIADKITQFVLTLCLSLKHPALVPVLCLFVVKELFQLAMGVINLRRGRMLSGALMAGKVCTTVLFVSLIFLVLFPRVSEGLVWAISLIDAVFITVSFAAYFRAYRELGKGNSAEEK